MKTLLTAICYVLLFLLGIVLMRWLRGSDDPISWFDIIVALAAGTAWMWFQRTLVRRRQLKNDLQEAPK